MAACLPTYLSHFHPQSTMIYTQREAVLQKRPGKHDGREAPLLFSLGSHSKQAGDERNLPYDISLFDASHLPFPDHVHDLVSLERVPCRFS